MSMFAKSTVLLRGKAFCGPGSPRAWCGIVSVLCSMRRRRLDFEDYLSALGPAPIRVLESAKL